MRGSWPACSSSSLLPSSPMVKSTQRVPILLDTDIGCVVDDAFALGLALSQPGGGIARRDDRRRSGRGPGLDGLPLADARRPHGCPGRFRPRRAAERANRLANPVSPPSGRRLEPHRQAGQATAVELALREAEGPAGRDHDRRLRSADERRAALREHPDAKSLIKRLVVMGGSLEWATSGKPPASRVEHQAGHGRGPRGASRPTCRCSSSRWMRRRACKLSARAASKASSPPARRWPRSWRT